MNDIKRVCVFASSSDFLDKSFYDAAEELGTLLGKAGYDMVYGGSSLGLMWACAKEVKKSELCPKDFIIWVFIQMNVLNFL